MVNNYFQCRGYPIAVLRWCDSYPEGVIFVSDSSSRERKPYLKSLHVYPVKSCRGFSVTESQVDPWGLKWDRAWMVVDDAGSFVTQRTYPSMAQIETALSEEQLILSAPDQSDLRVDYTTIPGSTRDVEIWGDNVEALDEGDEAAQWFSDLLGTDSRLVRRGADHHRTLPVNPNERSTTVGFADSHPFLLVSEASVETLNEYLENPITHDRFRPNFVIGNTEAFDEDYWKVIEISDVRMDVVRTKPRCKVVTVDQLQGEVRSTEPLELLARRRQNEEGVLFGRELVHHSSGSVIERGASIEVLETRDHVRTGEGTLQ